MAYPVFIQDECYIPAIEAFTGVPAKDIRKVWLEAKKGHSSAVLVVPGDMPASKVCSSCDIRAREDQIICVMCGHLFDERVGEE